MVKGITLGSDYKGYNLRGCDATYTGKKIINFYRNLLLLEGGSSSPGPKCKELLPDCMASLSNIYTVYSRI
jgi:hypothetical protein